MALTSSGEIKMESFVPVDNIDGCMNVESFAQVVGIIQANCSTVNKVLDDCEWKNVTRSKLLRGIHRVRSRNDDICDSTCIKQFVNTLFGCASYLYHKHSAFIKGRSLKRDRATTVSSSTDNGFSQRVVDHLRSELQNCRGKDGETLERQKKDVNIDKPAHMTPKRAIELMAWVFDRAMEVHGDEHHVSEIIAELHSAQPEMFGSLTPQDFDELLRLTVDIIASWDTMWSSSKKTWELCRGMCGGFGRMANNSGKPDMVVPRNPRFGFAQGYTVAERCAASVLEQESIHSTTMDDTLCATPCMDDAQCMADVSALSGSSFSCTCCDQKDDTGIKGYSERIVGWFVYSLGLVAGAVMVRHREVPQGLD